jgi:hypothetical protein
MRGAGVVNGDVAIVGATVIDGTDVPESPLVPGFNLHRELQRLVARG